MAGPPVASAAWAQLQAPSGWRSIELLSDLHLQADEPATFEVWRRYLAQTQADALFLLGDLFEVWVGDDAAREPGFESDCAQALQAAVQRRPVYFMAGNRDFLLGADFLARTGMQGLHDPTLLAFAGRRWLLSHGDALCLDDTDYQQFRAQVRSPGWQQAFLARPLGERRALARGIRAESEARKRSQPLLADVDAAMAREWLAAAAADTLVHGHTHRPGEHLLPGGGRRIVLSDWDATAEPARAQVLRLDAGGARRIDLV